MIAQLPEACERWLASDVPRLLAFERAREPLLTAAARLARAARDAGIEVHGTPLRRPSSS
jgi:hypothetical protein